MTWIRYSPAATRPELQYLMVDYDGMVRPVVNSSFQTYTVWWWPLIYVLLLAQAVSPADGSRARNFFLFCFPHSCSGTRRDFVQFLRMSAAAMTHLTCLKCWGADKMAKSQQLGLSFSCSGLTLELCRQLSGNSCLLSSDWPVIGFCVSD